MQSCHGILLLTVGQLYGLWWAGKPIYLDELRLLPPSELLALGAGLHPLGHNKAPCAGWTACCVWHQQAAGHAPVADGSTASSFEPASSFGMAPCLVNIGALSRPCPMGNCISRQICACFHIQAAGACRPWDFHNKGVPLPPCNDQRVATLRATMQVEGPPDPQIDHIISLICTIFKTEAALVSRGSCGAEGLCLAAIAYF